MAKKQEKEVKIKIKAPSLDEGVQKLIDLYNSFYPQENKSPWEKIGENIGGLGAPWANISQNLAYLPNWRENKVVTSMAALGNIAKGFSQGFNAVKSGRKQPTAQELSAMANIYKAVQPQEKKLQNASMADVYMMIISPPKASARYAYKFAINKLGYGDTEANKFAQEIAGLTTEQKKEMLQSMMTNNQ